MTNSYLWLLLSMCMKHFRYIITCYYTVITMKSNETEQEVFIELEACWGVEQHLAVADKGSRESSEFVHKSLVMFPVERW